MLQKPQFRGSLSSETQRLLQTVWPGPQVCRHTPRLHTLPEPHALPQLPQLAGSFWVSTHDGPQRMSGRPQLPGTQRLARQSSFGAQTVPQPPQLVRSVVVSVQVPLQTC